jgi:hypothetical protein
MLIIMVYDMLIFVQLGEWDDVMKVVFACAINPVMWEIPLTIVRTVSRTLPYNHPTTSYVFPSLIIAGKKATGRFVLATIKGTEYVRALQGSTLCSTCSRVTDGRVRCAMGRCDR